jgi:hypothetical protein
MIQRFRHFADLKAISQLFRMAKSGDSFTIYAKCEGARYLVLIVDICNLGSSANRWESVKIEGLR